MINAMSKQTGNKNNSAVAETIISNARFKPQSFI
jgi:hypothetical protein